MIIGGSGFIGCRLCAYLADCEHRVIASVRNLPASTVHPAVEYYELDLLDPRRNLPDMSQVDGVVYLAARAHILHEESTDPLTDYRRINVEAAIELVRHAANQGVKRFLYLSSIGVLGVKSQYAFSEPSPCGT